MSLTLPPGGLETIRRHAEAAYPEECCGLLIGTATAAGVHAERIVAAENEREDSRHNRYVISPQAVLAAHREARAAGLDVVGYYHSHPDHPAEPSEFDREHAWPGVSYLIVAVAGGRSEAARCWRLRDDRQRFDEETIDTPAAKEPR